MRGLWRGSSLLRPAVGKGSTCRCFCDPVQVPSNSTSIHLEHRWGNRYIRPAQQEIFLSEMPEEGYAFRSRRFLGLIDERSPLTWLHGRHQCCDVAGNVPVGALASKAARQLVHSCDCVVACQQLEQTVSRTAPLTCFANLRN